MKLKDVTFIFVISTAACLATNAGRDERRVKLNRYIEALHEDPVNIGKVLKHLKDYVKLETDEYMKCEEQSRESKESLDLSSELKIKLSEIDRRIEKSLDLLKRVAKYEKKIRQHIVDYRKNLELSESSNNTYMYVDGKLIAQSNDENVGHADTDIMTNTPYNYVAYIGNDKPYISETKHQHGIKIPLNNHQRHQGNEPKEEDLGQALTIIGTSIGLVVLTVVVVIVLQRKLAEINRIEPTIVQGPRRCRKLFNFKKQMQCKVPPNFYENPGLDVD